MFSPLASTLNKSGPQIEAIPTLIMASMILFFLPPFPFYATFLTPRERAIAQARLNRDHKPQSHGGMNGWQGFKAVVTDIHAWMFMTIYASCKTPVCLRDYHFKNNPVNVGVATISYFLPTVCGLILKSNRLRTFMSVFRSLRVSDLLQSTRKA